MVRSRRTLATTSAVALISIALGCGQEAPSFDAAIRYTPESLAEELAFRYKAMKHDTKAEVRGATKGKDLSADRVQAKARESTKEAESPSLDSLLADVGRKAAKVAGASRADVLKRVASLVDVDPSLKAPDKQALADGLKSLAGSN